MMPVSDDQLRHHWPVIGHDWAVHFLQKSLRHRRTRHAYLLVGPQGVGKARFALAFAMTLNCTHDALEQRPCGTCRSCRLYQSGNHPDLITAANDERSGQIKIDAVRDVARLLALKPFDSRYRVALFRDFDLTQGQAQDALLKTLEEPSPHAILLLLATSTRPILSTITSRCQTLPLRPIPIAQVQQALIERGCDAESADLLAHLSQGRVEWALQALEDETILAQRDDILGQLEKALAGNRAQRFHLAELLHEAARERKEDVRYTLLLWQTYWRDVLLAMHGQAISNRDRAASLGHLAQHITPAQALKALHATRHAIRTLDSNANVRMALDVMFLDYPRW